jgi:carboxypeptidase Taq
MTAHDDLMNHWRRIEALSAASGLLAWDQEVTMPRAGAPQRAEELGALAEVIHRERTDPRVADWLDGATAEARDDVARAQLRHIRRQHERAARLPGQLAAEIARVTSRAQGIWAAAREADDVAAFLPVLGDVVRLKRAEAAALAGDGSPYDALLEDFEPETTGDQIAALFAGMRPRLTRLRDAILGSDRNIPTLAGRFAEDAQMALGQEVARAFGFDFAAGRLDVSVHPFTSGSGRDVRITTRIDPEDPLGNLYAVIHETGHAAYEQAIDPAYALTPLGKGVSMGVHESQSRLYENQLGRSRGFAAWLFDRMTARFGDIGVADAAGFFAAVNRVHPGFIRTEADEVQYNLHIMLRFDLERALIAGDLAVGDLEAAWNDRFAADFGYAVDRPRNGMLQDVHWSVGLFGYFPTYALGNVYAACLMERLCRDSPELDASLAAGDPSPATAWLHRAVQCHGGLYPPREMIARAAGGTPTAAPLLRYLEAKFGALYDVTGALA